MFLRALNIISNYTTNKSSEGLLILPFSQHLKVQSKQYLRPHSVVVPGSREGATQLADLAGGLVDGYYITGTQRKKRYMK